MTNVRNHLSDTLSKRLRLKGEQAHAHVSSIRGGEVAKCTSHAEFTVSPHFKSRFSYDVRALIVSKVSSFVPPKLFVNFTRSHLLNL